MAEAGPATADKTQLVARIVASYVAHHLVEAGDLAALIATTGRAFDQLGRAVVEPAPEPSRPAVSIRRSVREDVVICLECGFRGAMLRRHLHRAHGLDVAAYRARWKLSPDHPLTAPRYSARRSQMAKQIGLGTSRQPEDAEASPAAAPPQGSQGSLDPVFLASLSGSTHR